ncbi:DUF5329 domain-containing protein [Congregibacter sp.]|uniref:DUF5329 domain-containing protein n=1 Tax=Congregibacter sp. TaxID=2744308 RepID=UPI003F6CFCD5
MTLCRLASFKTFVLVMLLSVGQHLLADVVDEEITFLISSVENSGCVFERNGDEHAAGDAADHLRLKYRRGKRYAGSAEQFIDRLASQSSWTGKPYFMKCPDTGDHKSGDWLTERLMSFRQSQAQ